MIDIKKSMTSFKKFLDKYDNKKELGFNLKVVHTYNVVKNAKEIATNLNLSEEDINLAELIGLLHDIGRFEEITSLKQFDSTGFDHAAYGVKILFEDNLIREFIEEDIYDGIIKTAIYNHSRLTIEECLDDKCLLHSKIIRDADKLDNFRVKKEEKIEEIFPKKLNKKEDIEKSIISDKVYEAVKNRKCVDIHDRKTILDYWICVLAFIFDLNFQESKQIVKDNDYINILIDRFKYVDVDTKNKIEDIRNIMNSFINNKGENEE